MSEQQVLKVVIEGDSAALVAALTQAEDRINKLTAKQSDVKGLSDSFENLSMSGIAKTVLGFSTLAGVAEKALDLVIEGIKSIIEIVPKSIEDTGKLVENYKQLSITAGMSVQEFNQWTATIALAGGKTEDLNDIVKGMERGIKNHSAALVANGVFASEDALKHATLGEYITAVVNKMESYGDATSRDQLLLDAFGKSGIAFAATLKEINERKDEGKKLGEETNVIDTEAIRLQKELTRTKGELSVIEAKAQAIISSKAIESDIAIQQQKINTLKLFTQEDKLEKALQDGLIKRIKIEKEVMDQNGAMTKLYIDDIEAEKKELDDFNEKLKLQLDTINKIKTVDSNDVGSTHAGDTAKAGSYDPHKAEKDQKAKEEAQKTAEAYRKAVEGANQAQERENILLTQGELAAFKYDLTLKGIIGSEQSKIVAQKTANDTLKENKKNEEDYIKDAIKRIEDYNKEVEKTNKLIEEGTKQATDHKYKLLENSITDAAKLGKISAEEEIKQLKSLDNLKYNEEVKAIKDEQALKEKEGTLSISEKQKNLNQLDKLTFQHNEYQRKQTLQLAVEQNRIYVEMWNSAESSVSKAISSMILEHQKLGQAIKSIFSSILSTVVNVFADMAAKSLIESLKEALGFKTAAAAKSAASLDTAVAESYAAYAWMPFVGMALAEAQIGAITAGFAASSAANLAITAHATGGMVDKPTLSLMGEAGPELIAPKQDFMEVTKALVASGASMYRSIVKSQAYQTASVATGGSYAASAPGGNQAIHVNLSGAIIAGESIESSRLIGQLVQKHLNNYNRRNA